jgi:tetratricopeptide (TPR) repeat protein
MAYVRFGFRAFFGIAAVTTALAVASPAVAQSTGMIKGKVVDAEGKPVEGARVVIEFTGGITRQHQTKTDKRGEFLQIGLTPGPYKVTVDKEKVGGQAQETRVRVGGSSDMEFRLTPAGGPGPSKEDLAKAAALNTAFSEGVALSKAGNYDQAIAKFTEAAAITPCADCYYNIGYAQLQKKAYADAEAAYRKALEIKPNSPEAYNGLATVFNAQRKFDEAAAASAKAVELSGGAAGAAGGAAGGGNADAIFNQGVILWNAGKIAEAKKQFEEAVKINPNHAGAHYQLGMALINEGKLAEAVAALETSVKLEPDGPNAAQAKQLIAQLKK